MHVICKAANSNQSIRTSSLSFQVVFAYETLRSAQKRNSYVKLRRFVPSPSPKDFQELFNWDQIEEEHSRQGCYRPIIRRITSLSDKRIDR